MVGIGAHNVSAWKKTNKDANYDYLWVDVLTMLLLFPGGRPPKINLIVQVFMKYTPVSGPSWDSRSSH